MEQRSEAWFQARCGSLGGSKIGDALSRLKRSNERTAAAEDFMYELAAERLTGVPAKRVNALWWGVEREPEALASYSFLTNAEVVKVGIIKHPTIEWAHASPDALIGVDGALEIKAPTSATHLRTLIDGKIPERHLPQLHWVLACTGRSWIDFLSYDPRFPPDMRLFVKRVERDDEAIAAQEAEAVSFLEELEGKLAALRERYPIGGEP